jgi:hypothetical protein
MIHSLENIFEKIIEIKRNGPTSFLNEVPPLLKEAYDDPNFSKNIIFPKLKKENYSRKLLIGDEIIGPAIWAISWPNSSYAPPHNHNGESCVNYITKGDLLVRNYKEIKRGKKYELNLINTEIKHSGDSVEIDPRINNVHSINSLSESQSLHVYPSYYESSEIFEFSEFSKKYNGSDLYIKKRINLNKEEEYKN